MKCDKCYYEWETKSKMYYVSCPRCLNKVKVQITAKQMGKNFMGLNK